MSEAVERQQKFDARIFLVELRFRTFFFLAGFGKIRPALCLLARVDMFGSVCCTSKHDQGSTDSFFVCGYVPFLQT